MTTLPNSPPPDKQKIFAELCWAKATIWAHDGGRIGDYVDPLQHWAKKHGLIEEIGQDAVQAIMADAFGRVR